VSSRQTHHWNHVREAHIGNYQRIGDITETLSIQDTNLLYKTHCILVNISQNRCPNQAICQDGHFLCYLLAFVWASHVIPEIAKDKTPILEMERWIQLYPGHSKIRSSIWSLWCVAYHSLQSHLAGPKNLHEPQISFIIHLNWFQFSGCLNLTACIDVKLRLLKKYLSNFKILGNWTWNIVRDQKWDCETLEYNYSAIRWCFKTGAVWRFMGLQ
jgi:hypothetical protein